MNESEKLSRSKTIQPVASNLSHRWHATRLIYQRDLHNMLWGPSFYIVISFAMFVAFLLLRNYMDFVGESGLVVLSGAFNFPLFAVIFLAAIFLALTSVTTIARERDLGTIEALFYGPIDGFSYILGKYMAQIVAYLVMMTVLGSGFWLYTAATNFTFPNTLGWVILLSILVTSDVIAFSIFLSALSNRVRSALSVFLIVVLILLVIQFGQELLAVIPLQSHYYNPALFLQDTLALLAQVVRWFSPFSYLMQGMEAVRRGEMSSYGLTCLIASLFTLLFLSLAVITLERKGVRR